MTETAPWWMAGSAFAAIMLREAWAWFASRKKNRAETDANVELLNALRSRLDVLEARVTEQDKRIEQELRLRLEAQEEASRLRMRVDQLENVLRGLGATVPPAWGARKEHQNKG